MFIAKNKSEREYQSCETSLKSVSSCNLCEDSMSLPVVDCAHVVLCGEILCTECGNFVERLEIPRAPTVKVGRLNNFTLASHSLAIG